MSDIELTEDEAQAQIEAEAEALAERPEVLGYAVRDATGMLIGTWSKRNFGDAMTVAKALGSTAAPLVELSEAPTMRLGVIEHAHEDAEPSLCLGITPEGKRRVVWGPLRHGVYLEGHVRWAGAAVGSRELATAITFLPRDEEINDVMAALYGEGVWCGDCDHEGPLHGRLACSACRRVLQSCARAAVWAVRRAEGAVDPTKTATP